MSGHFGDGISIEEGKMDQVIRPGDLQKVAAEKESARAREIAEADKRRADERHQLQEAFVNRQLTLR
jgi:hypothetical protein